MNKLTKKIAIFSLSTISLFSCNKKEKKFEVLVEYHNEIRVDTINNIYKIVKKYAWLDLPKSQNYKKIGDTIPILEIEEFNDKNNNNENDGEGEFIDKFPLIKEKASDTVGKIESLNETNKINGRYISTNQRISQKPMPNSSKNKISKVINTKIIVKQ